ncbi:MAG: AI-2E family transporter [Acidobacteria bacterium]|nr:MAG: AI-2E family transporter [Acidobacteriota bacterium]
MVLAPLSRMSERPAALSVAIPLWTLAVIALAFFLRFAQALFIPVALAILISYALEPAVAWLERLRVPRVLGATLLLLVFLGGTGWGVYALRDEAAQAFEALPEAARRLREMVSSTGREGPLGQVREAAAELGMGGGTDASAGQAAGGERKAGTGKAAGGGQPPGGGSSGSGPSGIVQRSASAVMDFASQVTVVIFLVMFLLIYSGHFKNRAVEVAGPDHGNRRITAQILHEIDGQIERFIFVRVVTGAIVGVATWGALTLMGVGQAVVWGILSGVFNSIPYFGPIIVSGGLAVVGVVQYNDAMMALKMAGVAMAITSLEGWIITPLLLGKAEEMHPLVVFLGLVVWSWIWGVWGTVLAVPMIAVVKSVCDHVEDLKPVGKLLGK